VLINVTGSIDIGLEEVETAANLVQEAAHPDANIIFGATFDESLEDEIRVTVIATGFDEALEYRAGVVNTVTSAAAAAPAAPAAPVAAAPAAPVAEAPAVETAPAAEAAPAAPAAEAAASDNDWDALVRIFSKRK